MRAEHATPGRARQQRGAALLVVSLGVIVLLGIAGLAVDAGRLFVNRAELQSAADACALAAAAELGCNPAAAGGTPCPSTYQLNAQAAGIYAGGRNRSDLQTGSVRISPDDVRFATSATPASGFSPAGGADPNATYAMCIARSEGGIAPWFMGALGFGAQAVAAQAVATLSPARSFCPGAPIGVCSKTAVAPDFGYARGEWITGTFSTAGGSDGLSGGFQWIDFTPNSGGSNEIRDQLAGTGQAVCGIRIGDNVLQAGRQQGAKTAWNTRFGIYTGGGSGYSVQTAPPDRTGYAYPNTAPGAPVIALGVSAYADYLVRQTGAVPFVASEYGVQGGGANISGDPAASAQLQQYGAPQRRLIAVPIITCGNNSTPILGVACVLMLNPMSNGANGSVYLEYRGNAANGGCLAAGQPGGTGAGGPRVPTLVQ